MNLTSKDIDLLDPKLFSKEDKLAIKELLYGKREEWTWKRDLELAGKELLRWKMLLERGETRGEPYKYSRSVIKLLAEKRPPSSFTPTVSAFANWIFRIYFPEVDTQRLARGRAVEAEVARRHIPIPKHGTWRLIYDGRGDNDVEPYKISSLAILGQPLSAKPDLIFRNKDSNDILIVELKATGASIPKDGWPNLRAQLWAYSKIDDFLDAPSIILASEIWGFSLPLLLRNRTLRWNAKDFELNSECEELFNIYKSHILNLNA
jgi:hypothetical protein